MPTSTTTTSTPQVECLNVCRMLTDEIYEGLDLKHEITAVNTQRLGDTVLLWDRNNDDAGERRIRTRTGKRRLMGQMILEDTSLVLFITILLISVSLVLASTNSLENMFSFVNGQELSNATPGNIKSAISSQVVEQSNGTTLHLDLSKVVKNINGSNVIMYGLNGQVPGPIIKVKQGSSIFVNLTNNIDMNSSIHWHGLKLNNKYDGVPGLTQDPVKPGQSYLYKLEFPNEGVYWYHSHFREDKQQDLAMYGVILVQPKSKDYYNPVDIEVPLTLDDILMANGSIYPYNNDHETFALMGRYGNVTLLNGKTDYNLDVNKDQTVRLFLVGILSLTCLHFLHAQLSECPNR